MYPTIHVVSSCQSVTPEITVKCRGAGDSQGTLGLKADHAIWWPCYFGKILCHDRLLCQLGIILCGL